MTLWSPFTSWAPSSNGNCTLAPLPKGAQQKFYFLQQLEKLNPPKMTLRQYTAINEPILISFITIFKPLHRTSTSCNESFSLLRKLSDEMWDLQTSRTPRACRWGFGRSFSSWTQSPRVTPLWHEAAIRTKTSLFLPQCSWLHWKGQKLLKLKLNSHIPSLQNTSHKVFL